MTELELLADELGVSGRTLRRAVNQGTLRASRLSPRRLEIAASEKRYVRRSWPLLASLRLALRTEANVRFALLFGSTARGDDRPRSDLDLLVGMADSSLDRVTGLSAKLEDRTGRRVDIVPIESTESAPGLLADALGEGRVLVDRDDRWGELAGRKERLRRHDRRRREIVDLLDDFPRQYAALETAMATFGNDFDLREFKRAYETETDMDAYNRVQAVERALGRVQNYVADLSIAGAKLADLDLSAGDHDALAARAFAALGDADVIGAELCRRLTRAQKARTMIEHSYVKVPAGNAHRAAELVHQSARDFIGRYRDWIESYL